MTIALFIYLFIWLPFVIIQMLDLFIYLFIWLPFVIIQMLDPSCKAIHSLFFGNVAIIR
jgi:hypothetical protein